MAMLLYYFASAVKSIQFHVDDDIIDKLNYYYTTAIITVFAILVSAKQYVGYPIQCWVPATFTEPMEQYTENYCWVQNTYFLPLHDYIPHNYAERENRQIGYYQWVPFVLALEALLFYVPTIVWRLLSWQSGIHVQSLVQMACDSRLLDLESRNRALQTIATNVEEALHVKHQVMGGNKLKLLNVIICTRSSGAAVTFLYISVKILYTVNIIGQIFLLNTFLGNRSKWYGLQVLNDLMNGREWEESGHFPRVTLCDFEVKVLGNVHRHTVQCVLMINMFNEKIFLFLWFWYFLLAGATFCSLLYWIYISIVPSRQLNFVGKYLTGIEGYKMVDSQSLRRFVFHFLRQDGVFLLRMVATHAGELPCYELAKALWSKYCDNKEGKMHDV
uniref:Innexin n=1 Tax=Strongyloides venezuelensis TaxID=75913 RepID=A0A0K0EX70_STRVS